MRIAYGKLGLKPKEFWRLTIAEIKTMIEAKTEQQQAEIKLEKWKLWHGEALRRQKRLMTLERFIKDHVTRVLKGEELDERREQHHDIIKSYNKAKT